jgi:hypothetical protein
MIRVNGSPLVAVQAETDVDAFDWLEKEWDEEHGAGDFDKQIVGVRLLQWRNEEVCQVKTPAIRTGTERQHLATAAYRHPAHAWRFSSRSEGAEHLNQPGHASVAHIHLELN